MPRKHLPSELTRAAEEEIRQRIRDDSHGKSEDVARLLGAIERSFDALGFDANELQADAETLYRFRGELGRDLKTYLDDLRAAFARHLVSKTDAKIHQIARLLGYTDTDLFSKWFKRRHGLAPTRLRSESSRVGDNVPLGEPRVTHPGRITAAKKQDLALGGWRRMFVGASKREEAVRLHRQIRREDASTHPDADPTTDFATVQ